MVKNKCSTAAAVTNTTKREAQFTHHVAHTRYSMLPGNTVVIHVPVVFIQLI